MNKVQYPENLLKKTFPNDEEMWNLSCQENDNLETAVTTLINERHRRILNQYFKQGMTYAEISKTENVTPSSIGDIIRRCLEKLGRPYSVNIIKYGKEEADRINSEQKNNKTGTYPLSENKFTEIPFTDGRIKADKLIELPNGDLTFIYDVETTEGRKKYLIVSSSLSDAESEMKKLTCDGGVIKYRENDFDYVDPVFTEYEEFEDVKVFKGNRPKGYSCYVGYIIDLRKKTVKYTLLYNTSIAL